MKRIFLFLAALSISFPAFAGEDGNRDENGKTGRTRYEINGIWDNWSVGAAGGLNFIGNLYVKPLPGAEVEFNISRWLTPCYGVRLGFQGLEGRGSSSREFKPYFYTENDGRYVDKFGFFYIHGDFLWNFTNEVWGYRERFYNCIPYAHAGGIITAFRDTDDRIRWPKEFVLGGGLLNTFKVCDRLDITLDVRGMLFRGRAIGIVPRLTYGVTTAIGLNVDLGVNSWRSSAGVTLEQWENAKDAVADANAALEQAKADAAAKDKALAAKDAELAKARADAEAARKDAAGKKSVFKDIAPATMYFNIGESELPIKERLHLDYYVKTILANVDPDRTIVITGTADKNTGSAARNRKLAEKRVQYVHDLLVNKYNIAPSRIVSKSEVVKAKSADAQLARSIVIAL